MIRAIAIVVLAALAAPLPLLKARADDGVWITRAGGKWSSPANWSQGAIAAGAGATADFSSVALAADGTLTLDSALTIGSIRFGDKAASHGWIVEGQGGRGVVLTLAGDRPTITVGPLGPEKQAAIRAVVAGSEGLTKKGPGTLALGGPEANTIAGTVLVDEGVLELAKPAGVAALACDNLHIGQRATSATVRLAADNQLPDATDVTIFQHGRFDLGGHSETINNLLDDGSGDSVVDGGGGAPLLAISAGDFAGAIKNTAGNLSVNKTTKGVLFLRGGNTHSGQTIVSEGTLALAGPSGNNLAASPQIRVDIGATLDVTGLRNREGLVLAPGQALAAAGKVRGKLTVGEGSKLAPGNLAGAMTHLGDQVWNGGGALVIDLGDGAGEGAAQPRLSISGKLHITAPAGQKFQIEVRGEQKGGGPWTLVAAKGGILLEGDGPLNQRIDVVGPSNSPPDQGSRGRFSVEQQGGSLVLKRSAQ